MCSVWVGVRFSGVFSVAGMCSVCWHVVCVHAHVCACVCMCGCLCACVCACMCVLWNGVRVCGPGVAYFWQNITGSVKKTVLNN